MEDEDTAASARRGRYDERVTHADSSHEARAAAAARLRTTLELSDFGRAMKRQQLRRDHPGLDEAEIDRLFLRWLLREDEDPGPCLRMRRPDPDRFADRDAPAAG